jgi:histone H3/H4
MAAKKEVETPMLIIASKMKEAVKDLDEEIRVSGELAEALSAKTYTLLKDAKERAIANGRKTIKPEDL